MTGDPTQDPRDVADGLGLQESRDDSDPGPDADGCAYCRLMFGVDYSPRHRHDRFDTREEYEEGR